MREPGAARLERLPSVELRDGVRVAVATGRAARARGLAGLDALPAGWALHIPRCRSVHTFGMRFEIDLIWLDAGGRVVRVDPRVPRRRVRSCLRARSVVECDGGAAGGFLAAGLEGAGLA